MLFPIPNERYADDAVGSKWTQIPAEILPEVLKETIYE